MKRSPRLLAAVVFAVAAALYMLTIIVRADMMGAALFLATVTVLPAAVAGFFLGARLERDAASVPSRRTRALRGLFAGVVLTALAYTLGITGFVMVDFVLHGSFTEAGVAQSLDFLFEILGGGIIEVLIGLPFGALAGTAFYLLIGKQADAV